MTRVSESHEVMDEIYFFLNHTRLMYPHGIFVHHILYASDRGSSIYIYEHTPVPYQSRTIDLQGFSSEQRILGNKDAHIYKLPKTVRNSIYICLSSHKKSGAVSIKSLYVCDLLPWKDTSNMYIYANNFTMCVEREIVPSERTWIGLAMQITSESTLREERLLPAIIEKVIYLYIIARNANSARSISERESYQSVRPWAN